MHCIAKTLLTELHLAILVPLSQLSLSLSLFLSPFSKSASSRRHPSCAFHSQLPTFDSLSLSLFLSLFLSFSFISSRTRSYDEDDEDEERRRRRRRRHCASSGVVGSNGGVGKPMGQDSETWNGIPEFLILLVNKCLGDSLLVRSYRPSFVSRRHCVLRFYLVFRSNGFPWLTVDKVARKLSLLFLFIFYFLFFPTFNPYLRISSWYFLSVHIHTCYHTIVFSCDY